ncbi:MAG TPA: MFS transporter, partial [Rubrobacteraceae bacterium]|nr:MFS transporter [Rubrobacteraceae bacterium]
MRRFLLFRNPVFGRFWGARIVSYLGSAATVAVLPLYVYETQGDPISVGILTLAMTLPRLLGPFAGTVSDRMDGKRLMILCDLGQAAMIGLAALLLPPFPVLVLLVAGSATLSTLFFPAGRSAVPALVAPDDLTPANAFLGTAANLGFALGPALGGSAFAVIGARGALAFDAVTFLVSAAFLASLPALPSAPKDGAALSAGFLAEVRDGLRYVSHQPLVRALVVGLFFGITFIAVDTVALVFLARGPLETGGAGYGLLASAHGVGMILGPLLLLRRVRLALVP